MLAIMQHFIQKLIPSFGLDPESSPDDLHPASRKRRVLTPEQRLRRKKLRERFLRRQFWLIPDAKPPRKRKCKSRKRRKYRGRKNPATALNQQNRQNRQAKQGSAGQPVKILKRQFKPLATELYNLPAGLVDLLRKNKLCLNNPKHLRAAHKIADRITQMNNEEAAKYGDEIMDDDDVQAVHETLDRLAENSEPISTQLEAIEKEFQERALDLQENHWSEHHKQKANNYPVKPMVYEPVRLDGIEGGGGGRGGGRGGGGMRDVME